MHTTTFTIESVHGVKQTFVLNVQDRDVPAQPGKDKPRVNPTPSDIASPQNTPSTTRSPLNLIQPEA